MAEIEKNGTFYVLLVVKKLRLRNILKLILRTATLVNMYLRY